MSENAEVNLVRCAKNDRPNLAITDLQPVKNVRAAGVPLFCDITVRNYGEDTAEKIQLKISTFLYDTDEIDASNPAGLAPEATEIPTVFFEEIKPGQSATQRFAVYFPKPGKHVIEAVLPEDNLMLDNKRRAVIEFVESAKALLIDDAQRLNAFYLSSAFAPGGKQNTGVASQIETTKFLRTATLAELQAFSSIYLLDVEQLEEASLRKIESYVANGGGLGIFLGPKVDTTFYNDSMFANGKGIFPVPLERAFTLPEKSNARQPDVIPAEHPIFSVFTGLEDSLLDLVNIESFLRPTPEWKQRLGDSAKVAAWIRQKGEDPLFIDKRFGEGRIVAVLTTAAPIWHNWSKNPTFVVTLLELQDYLASSSNRLQTLSVGNPIRESFDSEKFRSDMTVVAIGEDQDSRELRDVTATSQGSAEMQIAFGTNVDQGSPFIGKSGIYELWYTDREGKTNLNRYAVNLDENESNLEVSLVRDLLNRFDESNVKAINFDEFSPDPHHSSATQLSKILLGILLLILVLEQLLAYALSYHPSPSADTSKKARASGVR